MNYIGPLFPPIFAAILLIAYPSLTYVLLRRAGVSGPKLALSLLPVPFIFLGGYVFYWFLEFGNSPSIGMDAMVVVLIAKNLGVFIGAISPLLILALVKWPAVENSRLKVEKFE